MEPEASIPNSQELTCPYPDSDQSSHHPIPPLQDPSKYYPPTYVLVFIVASFPLAFPPTTYTHFSSPPFVLHAPPPHPPRLHYSNYTWRRVQIMKLFIMQFFHPPVTSSLFGPNILLRSLFSNTLTLCSSLNIF
jgi:hypothetical protein